MKCMDRRTFGTKKYWPLWRDGCYREVGVSVRCILYSQDSSFWRALGRRLNEAKEKNIAKKKSNSSGPPVQ